MELPFQSERRQAQWNADVTLQWVGPQRIPRPDAELDARPASEFERAFAVVNGQISRVFAPGIDVYLGVENILNYRQQNPIAGWDLAYTDDQDVPERTWTQALSTDRSLAGWCTLGDG